MYRILLIALLSLATGCSLFKSKAVKPKVISFKIANEEAAKGGQPRSVGRVSMVNSSGNFVIIESGPWGAPEKGVALKGFRDGTEVGILTMSSERRGRFLTADIVSGEFHRGDEVFQ